MHADATASPGARPPRGIVLLAAGRGQRMRPLTDRVPKALLPLGDGRTVLDTLIDAIRARSAAPLVVVTGFAAAAVDEHLRRRHGGRIATAFNARYEDDVNIVSVETGVSALPAPQHGYLIVETDLLLGDLLWDRLFAALQGSDDSFWVCRGVYSRALTGGVVQAAADGRIHAVDYRPQHDPACDGWPKMLGLLAVGPAEVAADRALRRQAMAQTIAQYYLNPWRDHLRHLPCRALRLDSGFAATFNTPAEFEHARDAWHAFEAAAA